MSVFASPAQQANPVLRLLSLVRVETREQVHDFVCAKSAVGVVYATTSFLLAKPKYLDKKLNHCERHAGAHGGGLARQVILLLVDTLAIVEGDSLLSVPAEQVIVAAHASAARRGWTLFCVQSAREAAEALTALETMAEARRAAGDLRGVLGRARGAAGAAAREAPATEFLAQCRGISRTDAKALLDQFGSLRETLKASREDILKVPGMANRKADLLATFLDAPIEVGDYAGTAV